MTIADVDQEIAGYEMLVQDDAWIRNARLDNPPALETFKENLEIGTEIHAQLEGFTSEAAYHQLRDRLEAARQTASSQVAALTAAWVAGFKTAVDEGIRVHVYGPDQVGNVEIMQAHVRLLRNQRSLGLPLLGLFELLGNYHLFQYAGEVASLKRTFENTWETLEAYLETTQEELRRLGAEV